MIRAGNDIEEAVRTVLTATQKAVPANYMWDWVQEESAIREMCVSASDKIKSGEWPSNNVITPDNWRDHLIRGGKNDSTKPYLANISLYLDNHNGFKNLIQYDSFSNKMLLCNPPISEPANDNILYPIELTEYHEGYMNQWFERHLNTQVTEHVISKAVKLTAKLNQVNLLIKRLESFTWDGTPRIDRWLIDYAGVEDTVLHRAWGRKFLISAIARAYGPGCQVDTTLILEGDQGIGKSTLARILCLKPEWFGDQLPPLYDLKAAQEYIEGKWIIEIAELSALSDSATTKTKNFLTARRESRRPAYGKKIIDSPRQCVFIGTTNPEGGYLRDATGARRFWPVYCTEIKCEALEAIVEQLWAEAIVAFKSGEIWHLSDEQKTLAKEAQGQRHEGDEWDDIFDKYITHKPSLSGDGLGTIKPHSEWLQREHPLTCIKPRDFLVDALGFKVKDVSARNGVTRTKSLFTSKGWRKRQIKMDGIPTDWYTKDGELPEIRSCSDGYFRIIRKKGSTSSDEDDGEKSVF